MAYNFFHGVETVDKLFSLYHNTRMESHLIKLKGGRFRADKMKYFFTHHIDKLWILRSQDVVMAVNLKGFKKGRGGQSYQWLLLGHLLPHELEAICLFVSGALYYMLM